MQALRRWMSGRNGFDRLNLTLLIPCLFVSGLPWVWPLQFPILGYILFRTFSRNVGKRRAELARHDAFMMKILLFLRPAIFLVVRAVTGVVRKFREIATRFSQRKDFTFPACPNCKKRLRVPRGKGTLEISCPVCSHTFRKKT